MAYFPPLPKYAVDFPEDFVINDLSTNIRTCKLFVVFVFMSGVAVFFHVATADFPKDADTSDLSSDLSSFS